MTLQEKYDKLLLFVQELARHEGFDGWGYYDDHYVGLLAGKGEIAADAKEILREIEKTQ